MDTLITTMAAALAFAQKHDPNRLVSLSQELEKINKALIQYKLPPLSEIGIDVPKLKGRSNFPTGYVLLLKRIYALQSLDLEITPAHQYSLKERQELYNKGKFRVAFNEITPQDQQLLAEVGKTHHSHLIMSLLNSAYYLPLEFTEIIPAPSCESKVLGSSHKLQQELLQIADAIGIFITDGTLLESEQERLATITRDTTDFGRESIAWFALFQATRVSLAFQTVLIVKPAFSV